MSTLRFFEDLLFVPIIHFIAGLFDSDALFSWHSSTASCKEKLLIALCNSLLIVLRDLWEQNILLLDEEWVWPLLDL